MTPTSPPPRRRSNAAVQSSTRSLLRTFVTIVDLRSFTRAGRRLGLSQSAISQQIGAQERQLGVKLLVRAGKGVRPTPAGEILLHYARQILQRSTRRSAC